MNKLLGESKSYDGTIIIVNMLPLLLVMTLPLIVNPSSQLGAADNK